jgi:hypothetical protein
MNAVITLQPRGLTQRAAALYLGVSVRWFRDNVHVEAKPVGRPVPGAKPFLRYRREDLDAWMDQCAAVKGTPVAERKVS